jgi:hypothetical protein
VLCCTMSCLFVSQLVALVVVQSRRHHHDAFFILRSGEYAIAQVETTSLIKREGFQHL